MRLVPPAHLPTLAFALLAATPARAQLHPAPHPRCVVTAHAPAALDDALDPHALPVLVVLDDVVAVVWRDRGDALRIQRFAPDLRSLEEPREVARPVRRFTASRTPSGLALAYVEGDHDLVVARLSAHLEAQNVPRVVESLAAPVTALSLAPVAGGLLLAWANASEVRALPLDARAVPQGASSVVLDQASVGTLDLQGADPVTLRADASVAGVEPWVVTLSTDGAVVGRARWPLGALGPVRVGGVVLTAQINPQGSPMLLRSNAMIAPAAIADPALAPRARLDALAVDRDLAVALVSDPSGGRLSLARLLPDGSASWLAGVRGVLTGPATMVVQAPSTVSLLTREASRGPARTTLQRYACALP